MHSLADGIFTGVGSVLGYADYRNPVFFLSLMEDSGYVARVAFVMDKLLRKIGLSGRSIVPMLIGSGCTVPAVMATRTLTSERDRKMTILLTPFMSCTAKLPIYSFFVSAFSRRRADLLWQVFTCLEFWWNPGGIFVYNRTLSREDPVLVCRGTSHYRLPGARECRVSFCGKKQKISCRERFHYPALH